MSSPNFGVVALPFFFPFPFYFSGVVPFFFLTSFFSFGFGAGFFSFYGFFSFDAGFFSFDAVFFFSFFELLLDGVGDGEGVFFPFLTGVLGALGAFGGDLGFFFLFLGEASSNNVTDLFDSPCLFFEIMLFCILDLGAAGGFFLLISMLMVSLVSCGAALGDFFAFYGTGFFTGFAFTAFKSSDGLLLVLLLLLLAVMYYLFFRIRSETYPISLLGRYGGLFGLRRGGALGSH